MRFLKTRDTLIKQFGWNRRVATLATRLLLDVDTWEDIAACLSWGGKPLLTAGEAIVIRNTLLLGDD